MAIVKSDENFIYFSCKMKLMKLAMPELNPVFVVDTEHEG